ncbi:MAG: hypothetical protein U0401_31190 [Anaerolineae bacterium]
MFIADSNNSRVLRFAGEPASSNRAAVSSVGPADFNSNTPATHKAGLDFPTGVFVDAAGRLWVSEFFNNQVLRF